MITPHLVDALDRQIARIEDQLAHERAGVSSDNDLSDEGWSAIWRLPRLRRARAGLYARLTRCSCRSCRRGA